MYGALLFVCGNCIQKGRFLMLACQTLKCYNKSKLVLLVVFTSNSQGYVLPKPKNCPPELYDFMVMCWAKEHTERPSFEQILQLLPLVRIVENSPTQTATKVDLVKASANYNVN